MGVEQALQCCDVFVNDLLEPLQLLIYVLREERLPVFEVQGDQVVMSTAELAGVPIQALGAKVAALPEHRDAIMRALDFRISGV